MRFNLVQKGWLFFRFVLRAKTRHSVHSPFVFSLAESLFSTRANFPLAAALSHYRVLRCNHSKLSLSDAGRTVAAVMRRSAMSDAEARLLAAAAVFSGAKNWLELGTNLGKSLAAVSAVTGARATGVEREPALATFCNEQLKQLNLTQARCETAAFHEFFTAYEGPAFDGAFIDGDHRFEATISNYQQLVPHLSQGSLVIFHDIYYSSEMQAAWMHVIQMPEVTVTVDLFLFGIAIRKPGQVKEHFDLRPTGWQLVRGFGFLF